MARLLLGALLPLLPLCAQDWESRLFPSLSGRHIRSVVSFAGRDWQLEDFSYAGYYLGARPLAAVPCRVLTIDASGNITQALETAVESVGRAGGGTVRIPAGRFTVDRTIAVTFNNVSIEGAGSSQTFISVPDTYVPRDASNEGLFTFGKAPGVWNQGWVHQGAFVTRVVRPVRRGDFHADTEDASSVRPGDWIVLQQYFWEDLVERNSSTPNRWVSDGSNRTFSFTYLRQVLARNGHRLFFDAPIPWTLDPAHNPVTIRFTNNRMVENVGVRGLSVEFADNRNSSDNRPLGAAVFFEGVRNGWAADMKARNIPRFGFYTVHSARITFLDCGVTGAQDYGDDGYGYGFHIHSSQNVLLKRCSVDDARRPFTSQRALTSVLVYSRCSSSNATQGDDTHHSLIHSVLWDRHTQRNGNNLTAYNRGNYSTGAYESFGSGVVWNFEGDGIRGRVSTGGQIHLKPSPDGQALLIGGAGAHAVFDGTRGNPFLAGERMQPSPDLQTGTRAAALRNVLYEGLGRAGLKPESLHEAQLAQRAGSAAIEFADACRASAFQVSPAGVVSAASSQPLLAPGALVSIYGHLPPSGASVRIGDLSAPILYAGPTQYNIQVPFEAAAGAPVLTITAGGQSADPLPIPIAPAAPAIFLDPQGRAVVQHPSGELVTPAAPARPGQVIVLYLTGAGPVDGSPPTGAPPGTARLFPVLLPAQASIGGRPAAIRFLGLSPSFTGLYQANLLAPSGLTPGDYPVQVIVDGVSSNSPLLPIGPP